MRLRFGAERTGPAIDLRAVDVDGATVAAAIRDPDDDRVESPAPGPVHERVGHVHADVSVPLRAALAAAARSRGRSAPQDDAIAAAEAAIADADPVETDLTAARRRLATAEADEDALRERVARLRGRIEARRAVGEATEAVENEREEALRELSTAETERLAAEQALAAARERAREARDERERRLRLADRADNLRRAARERLAGELYPAFADAVERVPGEASPGTEPAAFAGSEATAALAVVRVARVAAPVVVGGEQFGSAAAARERLDAPVVLV